MPYNELLASSRLVCETAIGGLTIRGPTIRTKMFVGHYSVAFACRTERNKIPLWVLFVAVQFLDYIWATLVLLGIEKLRVIKGFTAGSMLDSYFHPYSHSLITAVIWSVVAAFVYRTVCSRHPFDSARHGRQAGPLSHYSKSAPLIIGLAVFSHWILDLVAHPRDLAIYDNTCEGRVWFVEISRPGVCVGRSRCSPAASLFT